MATILIVDDEPLNVALIESYLEGNGHTLLTASSGEEALALSNEQRYDLVLLDIMMRGMNGFEAIRRLKEHAGEEFLPVVIVSSIGDTSSKVLGFRMGADDFLTKPLERYELTLRIENLLSLRRERLALARSNLERVELQRFRTDMSALIANDLKNPLGVMMANLSMVGHQVGDRADFANALTDALEAGRGLMRLLRNLEELTELEGGRLEPRRVTMELAPLMRALIGQRERLAQACSVELRMVLDAGLSFEIDADLVTRVLENILDNAIRHAPAGGLVKLSAHCQDELLEIRVGNNGPAIPWEARALVFEKFGQAELARTGRMNLGLGLYFCRLAAEAHGGTIRIEETSDLPTTFVIDIPRPLVRAVQSAI